MLIQYNVDLSPLHSFRLPTAARRVVHLKRDELINLSRFTEGTWRILSGGTNTVFIDEYHGTIIVLDICGIEILERSENQILVEVGASENWHQLVLWAAERNYGGIENLALIPGHAGAAPVQNIGAYGVELSDVLTQVEVWDCEERTFKILSAEDCQLDYRDSIFKRMKSTRYVISKIYLKLTTQHHNINVSYGRVREALGQNTDPSPADIVDTIIKIRQSKLPDPDLLPNAGSFFKNPIIDDEQWHKLIKKFPEIVWYKSGENYKLSCGYLIDYLGYKGHCEHGVCVYEKHALILCNKGNGNGQDLKNLIAKIQKGVQETFGIHIEPEVNLV